MRAVLTALRLGTLGMGLLGACVDSPQDVVRVPLFVAGADVGEPVIALGDVPVQIDRADLAFGPLYLCSGAQAGDLCDTARLEWLDSVVVDATVEDRMLVGDLVGVTGPVRSWMFDLGLSSQLTREEPFVLTAADALGGVSLVLEGRADVAGVLLPFRAEVPIQQEQETELGIPVLRRSGSDPFFHEVTVGDAGLLVRFDPRPWVVGIDFRRVASDRGCLTGSCPEVVFDPDTEAFRSVRNAVVAGPRPLFQWLPGG